MSNLNSSDSSPNFQRILAYTKALKTASKLASKYSGTAQIDAIIYNHLGPCGWWSDNETTPPGWEKIKFDFKKRTFAVLNTRIKFNLKKDDIAAMIQKGAEKIPNPVAQGIWRKISKKASCTCQLCGRKGQLREVDSRYQIMCSSCAAPVILKAELISAEIKLKRAQSMGTCWCSILLASPILRSLITSSGGIRIAESINSSEFSPHLCVTSREVSTEDNSIAYALSVIQRILAETI